MRRQNLQRETNSVLISHCNRNLERKVKIFGFEIFDLLLLGIVLAVLNITFKMSNYSFFISWGGTVLMGSLLYITKRNKPENFLLHKLQYWFRPRVYFAGIFDVNQKGYVTIDES